MTVPGKRITVTRSVVTGIRINNDGSLIVEGVDQGSAGQTLQSHSLSYPPGNELHSAEVAKAIIVIQNFAQQEVDRA